MVTAANSNASAALPGIITELREGQRRWAELPLRSRLNCVRRLRHEIAANADRLAREISRPTAETLVSEVLPLAEACRFLEQNAERVLAPCRVRGGPVWLRSVGLKITREPVGVVLIVGPANYPLLLPGVQLVQALVAGNAVALKPGTAGWPVASLFVSCVAEAGFPRDVVELLDESPASAQDAIESGVDKILITGSKRTGEAVIRSAGSRITPVIAELSGHDPVFVLPGADLGRAVEAIRFGLRFNGGNTCIRPRTVYGSAATLARIREELGPVDLEFVVVASMDEAVRIASENEFALGATIFGDSRDAESLAAQIRAGVVVINDMIVPTAHPALPFGGRGSSGYGVTRGAEGLLELTNVKAVAVQHGRWLPHLMPAKPSDERIFAAFIRALHAGKLSKRIAACGDMWRALLERRKEH